MKCNTIIILILFNIINSNKAFTQNKHFLTFYATESGRVGHAFVSFVREDDKRKMTVLDGCWGFYPKNSLKGGASFLIGEVPGEIRNDFLTQKDIGLTIEVNQKEYNKALGIKKKWESSNYNLTVQDCVSFAMEVANSLSGKLILPKRAFYDYPHDYINELKLINKLSGICDFHPDIVDVYDKKSSTFHSYSHTYEICDSIKYPCCNEEFVFNVMKSSAEFVAPYAKNENVSNCGKIDLIGFGSIATKFGTNPYSITNYTKYNHLLHEGKVVRYVVTVGTKVNVYTVGFGNNKNKLLKYLNENRLSVNAIWGGVAEKLKIEVEKRLELEKSNNRCGEKNTTLFLFDLSGSMSGNGANSNKSKLQQAKGASKATLNSLKNNNSGITEEVGVLGFSGGCSADPTTIISNFDSDLSSVETKIDGMYAGGGTPLAEAIAASECKLANHLYQNGQDKGKLIILSDGQATCTKIRPTGVYNTGQLGQQIKTVNANQCGSSGATALQSKIKYYTIGFNIAAGSSAERDLQYLAQISGGKYLNVQSQVQLERAFRKFNRTYIPKPNPSLSNLPNSSTVQFDKGVSQVNAESFKTALETNQKFAKLHPNDCHGVYNLALMQEVNDFYKDAIDNYRQYLSLCQEASDKNFVEKQITFLEEEFKEFILFQKKVVQSDLEYLELHFKKIQNGESVALAEEFKGFLKEKGDYYRLLPQLIGRTDRLFKRNTGEVARGLEKCNSTINRNPKTWDRDATPVLSMTYLNLERLIQGF